VGVGCGGGAVWGSGYVVLLCTVVGGGGGGGGFCKFFANQ
jgi:hypothetical protein